MRRVLIVPAAGLGSRLRTDVPKALVLVNGKPMIDHVVDRFRPFVERVVYVVAPSFTPRLREHLGEGAPLPWDVAEQDRPTGMLDAILAAAPLIEDRDAERVWIAWCDQVGVLPQTLHELAAQEAAGAGPAMVFPTVQLNEPYIHFVREPDGRISGVRQRREGDEMPARGESDMGVFSLSRQAYLEQLPTFAATVPLGAGTRERNFLPFIPWLAFKGSVATVPSTDPMEATGINTPEDLVAMEDWLRTRVPQA
jgi:bifunctional N-acetylglucosamine-1-phosphate-uridyltransferase/glucosamine-1-phosphate-acetyltransferase GlmU-like protein